MASRGFRSPSDSNRACDFSVDSQHRTRYHFLLRGNMSDPKTDIPYGTLDLLVLKTLEAMGPLHGFGVARRIEQISGDLLHLNQGSIYPALMRLQQKGWVKTEWGASDNNRRAKFYSLTKTGKKQLKQEVESWEKTSALVARFLEVKP